MVRADWSCFRLQIIAEADPGILARVIARFQHLNILPRKVVAEASTDGVCHILVEITGVSDETINLIAGRISQVPSTLDVRWHRR